jgi:hypothetical protein
LKTSSQLLVLVALTTPILEIKSPILPAVSGVNWTVSVS